MWANHHSNKLFMEIKPKHVTTILLLRSNMTRTWSRSPGDLLRLLLPRTATICPAPPDAPSYLHPTIRGEWGEILIQLHFRYSWMKMMSGLTGSNSYPLTLGNKFLVQSLESFTNVRHNYGQWNACLIRKQRKRVSYVHYMKRRKRRMHRHPLRREGKWMWDVPKRGGKEECREWDISQEEDICSL